MTLSQFLSRLTDIAEVMPGSTKVVCKFLGMEEAHEIIDLDGIIDTQPVVELLISKTPMKSPTLKP